MPFGLCKAPASFQRSMITIFFGLTKQIMEGFMDDFSMHGNSYDNCIDNLSIILERCQQVHLFLNWEKCHFMVREGIDLRHHI